MRKSGGSQSKPEPLPHLEVQQPMREPRGAKEGTREESEEGTMTPTLCEDCFREEGSATSML